MPELTQPVSPVIRATRPAIVPDVLSSLTPLQFRVIVALLGVLAVVLIALIAVQLTGLGNEDPTAGVTTLPTTESTTTTTTTEPTTTTTTESTTTTTTLPPAPTLVLEDDGLDAVGFGTGVTETIAIISAALGEEPDTDTGWLDFFDNPYGTCPPPEVRGVEWGMLTVLFTSAETDFAPEGTRHFFSYTYAPQSDKPGAGPFGLKTGDRIGLGSTVEELEATYGDRVEIFDDPVVGAFWAVDLDFETDTGIGGNLTGVESTDRVASVIGGTGCGE
jgi:hypothetical protein